MARSSAGRRARRPVGGDEPSPPEECAISLFHTNRDTTLRAEAGFCPECGYAVEANPGRIPGFDVPEEGMDLEATLHKIEAQLLIKALERTNGVQKRAATLLSLGYHEFRYKIQKHKLESLARSIANPGRSLPRGSDR